MKDQVTYSADQLIARYVELRDEKSALAKKHQQEMAPLNEAMDALESALMNILNAQGGQNIKTPSGTAYRSETLAVKVEDWDSYFYWVMRFGGSDFFIRQADKTAIEQLLEEKKQLPPGIATKTIYRLNVRRG